MGSLLVIGLFYTSQLAPLQTLNWLIRNMLVYVAFAALRSSSPTSAAPSRTRPGAVLPLLNRQEAADETIEEMVVAATSLAAEGRRDLRR